MKRVVVKLIDYAFQNEGQLIKASDDSNTMKGLKKDLDCYVVGRYGDSVAIHDVDEYKVIFLPTYFSQEDVAKYIIEKIKPDIIHIHGNHSWPQYPYYASRFRKSIKGIKLIFSPAGSSCGTPEFLSFFDNIIVNHKLQIGRMKVSGPGGRDKILVRKRCANPDIFYADYFQRQYDFVYVAGFVPVKQIPVMIDMVATTQRTMVVLGDFTRTVEHHLYVKNYIEQNGLGHQIFLHDFIPQEEMSTFLGQCGVFVWPNIKPENPSTTTNRAVTEALACGMPLLLGERAFDQTNYIQKGVNGFTYSDSKIFRIYSDKIFQNIHKFRAGSITRAKTSFNYKRNFISFYNRLYS